MKMWTYGDWQGLLITGQAPLGGSGHADSLPCPETAQYCVVVGRGLGGFGRGLGGL